MDFVHALALPQGSLEQTAHAWVFSGSVMSDSLQPYGLQPTKPPVRGIFQARKWSVLLFPSPGDLPNPGIKSRSPTLQTESLPLSHWGSPANSSDLFNSDTVALGTFPYLSTGHILCARHGDTC